MLDAVDLDIFVDLGDLAVSGISDNEKNNGPGCFIIGLIIFIILALVLYYN